LGRRATAQIRYVADGWPTRNSDGTYTGAGTGNLLARNLDLPLEEVEAVEVALGGQVRLLDLVRITVDDRARSISP
jgi:hypothetical protein